ncbi:MAG: succinate dehydrogenase, cytochrome b556 subunit [Gammaproteobacteria bacterium]|nr:MAG: succinate dehydrogenase, cytochrome b556 subunit [Gammaproteobacteria bacterium]
MSAERRPVFLNLLQIRLPWTGVASILHRVAGVILFLSIAPSLYLLQRSLDGESGWMHVVGLLHAPLMQPVLLLLFWAFWHHFLNGLRLLAMDLGHGFGRSVSARGSLWILLLAPVLAVLCLGDLW